MNKYFIAMASFLFGMNFMATFAWLSGNLIAPAINVLSSWLAVFIYLLLILILNQHKREVSEHGKTK